MGEFVVWIIAILAIIVSYVAYKRAERSREPKHEKYHWQCDRCLRRKVKYKISSNEHATLMNLIEMHNHDFHMGPEDQ